jgi:multicomponent Na+:H+ antiporter subunit G
MEAWIDMARFGVSSVLILIGLFFVIVGAIGVLRFPDFYTRLHAAGVTDTLGAELVILGLIVRSDALIDVAKLALIGLFLFLTSPTSTHAVANAAYTAGVEPLLGRFKPSRPGEEPEEEES